MNYKEKETGLSIPSGFFSDETECFRSPSEPDPGQTVAIRIRCPRSEDLEVFLKTDHRKAPVKMKKIRSDLYHSIYESHVKCQDDTVSYYFIIRCSGEEYLYLKDGLRQANDDDYPDPLMFFRFTPGFHVPEWAKGAVQYQIFMDRFRNGDPSNDVVEGEYSSNDQHVKRVDDWNRPPSCEDYRCFYGGDIRGMMEKLDYLKELGVEVVYLNPIFIAPSSHKYDTQDYEHVDPHFGVIEDDEDFVFQDWEQHNGYARKYIARVLSEKNLSKTDALFAELCKGLHDRGMKIILDGVFNHCGSFHKWMDREGIYRDKKGFAPGAWQDEKSPYRDYFHFIDNPPGYEAWWDVKTLPKLCYEQSENLCRDIFNIAEKWLRPPYSIDGWRLDVAADLGHDISMNHKFWKEFRNRVKAVNPDAVIIAEHYGDPSPWLKGDQWDTVMNYDAFMEPVSFFLTGMEKHSEYRRDDLYQDGRMFFESMAEHMAVFQSGSLMCAMNQLSNHDHSRFYTRTNRVSGRLHNMGSEAAGEGVDRQVFMEAVVIQMTWPGAPTIYYGDEAGVVGWTDPDNRRTYPWGNEDNVLIDLHTILSKFRKEHPMLRTGSVIPLASGEGLIAYARFDEEDKVIVACNNADEEISLSLFVRDAGAKEGEVFSEVIRTDEKGIDRVRRIKVTSRGSISVRLGAKSAIVLENIRNHDTV